MGVSGYFRIDRPSVVSETIDGEAVILDLRMGAYFSIRGTGAAIWSGIESGRSVEEIADTLAQLYPAEAEQARSATSAFMAALCARNLIVPGQDPEAIPAAPHAASPHFVPPEIESYSDMQDLLLLDPIHDIAQEIGWPARKPVARPV